MQVLQDAPARAGRSSRDQAAKGQPQAGGRAPARPLHLRRPLHVLHVFQPETGGVPAYVVALTAGLMEAGVRVSVACPPATAAADLLADLGVDVVPIELRRAPHPLSDAIAVRTLKRWCRERQVNLIHGHSTKAGMLSALVASATGLPSVYTPHGWSFQQLVALPIRTGYALFERHLAHRYHAAVLCESSSSRGAAERWRVARPGRAHVIPNAVPASPALDRAAARAELGIAPREVVALWVGRVDRAKRPEDLAPLARRLGEHARVVAFCQGVHGTPLEAEMRGAGVLLVDPQTSPALGYAAADLVVQTSAWEGAPLAVLEAMAAALPVVAYDVGGVSEQVLPGRTGHLVAPRDLEMLAECVLTLAGRPALRVRMGQAGRRRGEELFSYTAMVEGMIRAYRTYGRGDAGRDAGIDELLARA